MEEHPIYMTMFLQNLSSVLALPFCKMARYYGFREIQLLQVFVDRMMNDQKKNHGNDGRLEAQPSVPAIVYWDILKKKTVANLKKNAGRGQTSKWGLRTCSWRSSQRSTIGWLALRDDRVVSLWNWVVQPLASRGRLL